MTPRHSDEEGRGDESSLPDDDWAYTGDDRGDDDRGDDDVAFDDELDDPFDDLDDDVWTEEDERRYQARRRQERLRARRRRRQATSFGLVVLLVLAAGLGAVGLYLGWWSWPSGGSAAPAATPQVCPQPTPTAAAAKDVSVTVLNSTDHRGLAASVAQQLSARGFAIAGVGNDPAHGSVQEAAQVRHGPKGLMAARAVAAQIKGAVLVDDGRTGPSVDVSMGAGFTDMNTIEQAAALTAPQPVPSPSGCVSQLPQPTSS
ncbi:MAG: LytR C-terminal domain-containing protein [Actinomycetes bacterium]